MPRLRHRSARGAAAVLSGGLSGYRAGRQDRLAEEGERNKERRYEALFNQRREEHSAKLKAAEQKALTDLATRQATTEWLLELGNRHDRERREHLGQISGETEADRARIQAGLDQSRQRLREYQMAVEAAGLDGFSDAEKRMLLDLVKAEESTKLIAQDFAWADAEITAAEESGSILPEHSQQLRERLQDPTVPVGPADVRKTITEANNLAAQGDMLQMRQQRGSTKFQSRMVDPNASEEAVELAEWIFAKWNRTGYRKMQVDQMMRYVDQALAGQITRRTQFENALQDDRLQSVEEALGALQGPERGRVVRGPTPEQMARQFGEGGEEQPRNLKDLSPEERLQVIREMRAQAGASEGE